MLRIGAELDVSVGQIRGGSAESFKYIYMPQEISHEVHTRSVLNATSDEGTPQNGFYSETDDQHHLEPRTALKLPPASKLRSRSSGASCEEPRLFHMFWTGPFTDKPYMALLSFLYTQNLGLHLPANAPPPTCRPELWFWITQPEWGFYKRATWDKRMEFELRANSWAAPFLHPRFKDVIKFKVWDAVERLDETEELKGEWRKYHHVKLVGKAPRKDGEVSDARESADEADEALDAANATLLTRSSGAASYDKPSVSLSDMVRFVLCHRFGGTYLDVDTLFLRDWEELWGWSGAFAYRWSRLERYNTAVLRMHKGSALGTFLLRTALQNGFKFHPIRISSYLKDAQMEGLLTRLADALFDPAWLMVEGYHPEKPPQPFLNT